MTSIKIGLLLLLLLAIYVSAIDAVQITGLKVPEYFILKNESSNIIILDCEYKLENNENDFTFKWLKDDYIIYQWINGAKQPFVLANMRGKIDDTFEATGENVHRALILREPSRNTTGNYTCAVLTSKSMAKKYRHLQIIDLRKSSFAIAYEVIGDNVKVTCEASNIYPLPKLRLMLNREENVTVASQDLDKKKSGYFDISISAAITKDKLESDTEFTCRLSFNDTNYTEIRSFIYSGSSHIHLSVVSLLIVALPYLFS